jgi:hypothetical protein
MSIEAMKQALEALETLNSGDTYKTHNAATALRAAIEQAEPVAWADKYDIEREGHDFYVNRQQPAKDGVPLYTAPSKREWVGLTDEDIYSIIESNVPPKLTSLFDMAAWMAKVVEARLKEKNNA